MSSGIGNRKMAAAPVCCSNSCPVALKCAWKKIYAHDLRSPSPDQLTQQPFFLASTSVLRKRDSVSSSVSIRKVVMSAAHPPRPAHTLLGQGLFHSISNQC